MDVDKMPIKVFKGEIRKKRILSVAFPVGKKVAVTNKQQLGRFGEILSVKSDGVEDEP